jgi:hypothetical protein
MKLRKKSLSYRVILSAAGFLAAALAMVVWIGGQPLSKGSNPDRATPALAALDGGRERLLEAYANLPLTFVENQGETDSQVRYYARGPRYAFYLTRDGVVLSFTKRPGAPDAETPAVARVAATEQRAPYGVALALRFPGSNPQMVLEGGEQAPGKVNFFRGNDPTRWRTNLPQYGQVIYRELWPGVDLALRGEAGMLKYEFRVKPGAKPADIRMAYEGAAGLVLDEAGGLLIKTAVGLLRDSPPVAYHEIDGVRVPVESRYALGQGDGAEGIYGFAVGAGYNPDAELIIDPSVSYSTFLGGSADDTGAAIAVDPSGNAYVIGTTSSTDFPTTTGAFDRTLATAPDIFVSKLNATGTALLYSTYLGGTPTPTRGAGSDPFEFGRAIAVDASGNAYITGQTTSSDFPITAGAFQTTIHASEFDATETFVAKLNPTGSALLYSTFLGGSDLDDSYTIAVDASGAAYVAGYTLSTDFPTTPGAVQTLAGGGGNQDAFITKLNATGSALVYSTYLGGLDNETLSRIVVDTSGNAYVTGGSRSLNFPTTAGAFQTANHGGFDAFVAKLNATGSALVYSTFIGGQGTGDSGNGLAIDSAGNAYVAGGTNSIDFPTTPGAFQTTWNNASGTGFVAKVNPTGSALVYSTFLGGTGGEGASAVAVDGTGNAWVAGTTTSIDFPTTPDALSRSLHNPSSGTGDVFITQLNAAGSGLIYSTYFGGTDIDNGNDLALDSAGNVYLTGKTNSADFPTTPGAVDTVFKGNPSLFLGDAFITKLTTAAATSPTITSTPVTTGVVGQAYSYQAAATGSAPITWSLVTGPSGMTIGSATGLVSWTPTAAGSFPVTIQATNSAGSNQQSYTLTVSAATNTGLKSPTANAAETSSAGDNNGYETTPGNAQALDGLFAVDANSGTSTSTSCTDAGKDKHRFYNYNFSVPAGSTIKGITIRLDAKVNSTSGSPKICVQLSWNGGTSWTTAKSTATLGTALQTFTLGSATDTWGRTWSVNDFTNANFRVRVIDVASSTSGTFSLDRVAAQVNY